jgi:hypothetical protein
MVIRLKGNIGRYSRGESITEKGIGGMGPSVDLFL